MSSEHNKQLDPIKAGFNSWQMISAHGANHTPLAEKDLRTITNKQIDKAIKEVKNNKPKTKFKQIGKTVTEKLEKRTIYDTEQYLDIRAEVKALMDAAKREIHRKEVKDGTRFAFMTGYDGKKLIAEVTVRDFEKLANCEPCIECSCGCAFCNE